MSSESRTTSENLRFAEDAHHILESLFKEVHKARRQKDEVNIQGVRSLVDDLITFAEYQGYDVIWRLLLPIRVMAPDAALDELDEFVATMLEGVKRIPDELERNDAVLAPARKSIAAAMRSIDPEIQRRIRHVVDIHLDIFNNLVHNLTDETQRTVYLDSLDNCIFSLRDLTFAPLQDMLSRHRTLLGNPVDAKQVKELKRDLQLLGQLTQDSTSTEFTRKGNLIDVRVVLPDMRVLMHNVRHLINRLVQSKRTKGLVEPWRANVTELLKVFRKLSLPSATESLKYLDRLFKEWDEDSPSLVDNYLRLVHVVTQETEIPDQSLTGHDHVSYHDLAAWQTDKQLYRLLDTEYLLQRQLLVDTDRIPEIIDAAADLTAIRLSLTALSQDLRADVAGVRAAHALDELNSQLNKVSRRLVKTTDSVQRVDGRFLLNRLEKEFARSGKKNRAVCQMWVDDHDVRMELSLVEDLENPLLELVRQMGDRVVVEGDSITLELALAETAYTYEFSLGEMDGHPAWSDLLATLMGSAVTRSERLREFVRAVLNYRMDGSEAIGDFVQRGLDKLRCDVLVRPSDWTLSIPKRQLFAQVYLLKSENDIYVIPVTAVHDTRTIGEDQLLIVHGQRMFRHDGKLIVAIALNQLVHPDQTTIGRTIVIVNTPGKPTGLLVDEAMGTDEVAVKPLDEVLRAGHVFSGGAVLADGNIGLFIDPIELGELSEQTETSVRQFLETQRVN